MSLQRRSRSAVCSPPGEHAQHRTQHYTRTAHTSAAPMAFGAMCCRVCVRYRFKYRMPIHVPTAVTQRKACEDTNLCGSAGREAASRGESPEGLEAASGCALYSPC
eukprot:6913191-Prymnesium_polylepis.2